MRTFLIVPAIAAVALALASCGSTSSDRVLSGAAIGGIAGQAIGHDTAATVGGAVLGGVVGAATTP